MNRVKIVAFSNCAQAKGWIVWLEEMKIPFEFLEADDLPDWHPEKKLSPSLSIAGRAVRLDRCDRRLFRQKIIYWLGEMRASA